MTHCTKCGAELIGERKFCAACGSPVASPISASAASVPPVRPDFKTHSDPLARTAPLQTSSPYGPPLKPLSPLASSSMLAAAPVVPFGLGTQVLVLWVDGNRYSGTIHQLADHQCLVVFPDGQQHWIPTQYLSPAG